MDKNKVLSSLKQLKEKSSKRKFIQSVDLIVNLKDIDLKKPEQSLNYYVSVHYLRGKKTKVCGLVGPELITQAKATFDNALSVDDFNKYEGNKKDAKKLASAYDYFVAQATIMPRLATIFGRVFGPKGRMPNPKAGCVVPPNANLKPLYERLQKTVKLQTKNDPIVQTMVGMENQSDEEIADNVMTIYDSLVHTLPGGKNNIKSVLLKLTMGKPLRVE
ncbi:MAG TPA: 50S ribosomal protein L1 [Candidatus Nanoarchaeia archaeon]|nr:50S ribosomal protein L1 [Candidatus Nanoarchaeia archaeon]